MIDNFVNKLINFIHCLHLEDHPSLVMDGVPIKEAGALSVSGIHRLTLATMIDKMVSSSRQNLRCLFRI